LGGRSIGLGSAGTHACDGSGTINAIGKPCAVPPAA
jgi:hypothetical protein